MEINKIKELVAGWGRQNPSILKIHLFGSIVTGISHKTQQPFNSESDIDIAIEFEKFDSDENLLATWMHEGEIWHKELMDILSLKDQRALDLQWYHPLETPAMDKYIQRGAKVLYVSVKRRLHDLNNELYIVYHHLDMFKKFGEIVENNLKLKKIDDWTLLAWMKRAFTADLVISIGRICDIDDRSNSLYQFLRELSENSFYLTRKRYVKLHTTCNKLMEIFAHQSFDRLAGVGNDAFPVEIIQEDMEMLISKNPCKKIRDYRHKYLAHSDIDKMNDKPTYNELFLAFNVIEEIVKKYNLLINAVSGDLTPMPQSDWMKILTIPWLESPSKHN